MIQEQIEELFSKKHRKNIVLAELLEANGFNELLMDSVYRVQQYLQQETDSEIKKARLEEVWNQYQDTDDLIDMIEHMYALMFEQRGRIPLVSLANMMSGWLRLPKQYGIQTMAEIMVVLAELDFYDIDFHKGQLSFKPKYTVSEETRIRLNQLMYLPPMISEPKVITKNKDNYHFTLSPESMILGGKENHHDGEICLDILNRLSQQELVIDQEFVEENKPTKPEGMVVDDWDMYVNQLDFVNELLGNNTIYLTHKVDKRGRVYSCGYHVDTQGDDYHKACIELANKHIIEVD